MGLCNSRPIRASRAFPTGDKSMASRASLTGFVLVVAIALLAAAARPLAATSVVLGSDGELADQAPVVMEATVLASVPALPASPARGNSTAPSTDYLLRVERVLKGGLPAGTGPVRLRVLGGPGPDGLTLKVWGSPELRAGERVLLFLAGPRADRSDPPPPPAGGRFPPGGTAPAARPGGRGRKGPPGGG